MTGAFAFKGPATLAAAAVYTVMNGNIKALLLLIMARAVRLSIGSKPWPTVSSPVCGRRPKIFYKYMTCTKKVTLRRERLGRLSTRGPPETYTASEMVILVPEPVQPRR